LADRGKRLKEKGESIAGKLGGWKGKELRRIEELKVRK
jgi:hypothetical protein